MVGRDVIFTIHKNPAHPGEVALSVEAVCAENDRGLPALRDFSVQVRAGEIVGIAGRLIAYLLQNQVKRDAALAHLNQGLALLPWWGKPDDLALTYVTLARLHLAQANRSAAIEAVEKAMKAIQTSGVFPEALHATELAKVKLWLVQGDLQAATRWAATARCWAAH